MTSEPRRSVWPFIAVFVLLPLLYLGSMAPVFSTLRHWDVSEKVADAIALFYLPAIEAVSWVCKRSETTDCLSQWYFGLWGVT